MLAKKVGKVGGFGEAQAIGNVGHGPVGVAEQRFGFLRHALGQQGTGGAARDLAQGPVQVVDVHAETAGKAFRVGQGQGPGRRSKGKLLFQQLGELRGQAPGSRGLGW